MRISSVRATVRLVCTSSVRPGVHCGEKFTSTTTDTGVDPLAKARGAGWVFFRGAARCRDCGDAARSFGPATLPYKAVAQ